MAILTLAQSDGSKATPALLTPSSARGAEAARWNSTKAAKSVSNAMPITRAFAAPHSDPVPERKLNLHFRSNLSLSGGRITGSWEERTYNAQGNASGQVSGGKISLNISGGVTGTMSLPTPPRDRAFRSNAGDRPGKREDRPDPKLLAPRIGWVVAAVSALPLKADMLSADIDVR